MGYAPEEDKGKREVKKGDQRVAVAAGWSVQFSDTRGRREEANASNL